MKQRLLQIENTQTMVSQSQTYPSFLLIGKNMFHHACIRVTNQYYISGLSELRQYHIYTHIIGYMWLLKPRHLLTSNSLLEVATCQMRLETFCHIQPGMPPRVKQSHSNDQLNLGSTVPTCTNDVKFHAFQKFDQLGI